MLHRHRRHAHHTIFRIVFGGRPAPALRSTDRRLAGADGSQHPGCQCNGSMWARGLDRRRAAGHAQSRCLETGQATLGMPILIDMKKSPVDAWKPSLQRQGRAILQLDHQAARSGHLRSRLRAGFLCAGNLDPRRRPIPSSPVNSMAKGSPKAASPKAAATAEDHRVRPNGCQYGRSEAGRWCRPMRRDICLLPTSRVCPLARLEQQHRASREQREREQLAHARSSRMRGQPQAAEGRGGGQGAENIARVRLSAAVRSADRHAVT